MTPDDLRSQIQTLQQTIERLLEGWTLVVCSSHQRFVDTAALLLPALQFTSHSTAECLGDSGKPAPSTGEWSCDGRPVLD